MEIAAPLVSPLNKYYPTALLDEHGKAISLPKLSGKLEFIGSDVYKLYLIREPKMTKNLENCQDYALISVKGNGDRKVVIADGVSNAVGSQSVANLISHKTIEALLSLDDQDIDISTVIGILEADNLDLACSFFRERFMRELEESIKLRMHKEVVVRQVDKGAYGSSTLSFMRLQKNILDICMYGTGGYLILRGNEIISSYGKKEKRPPQIMVNCKFESKEIHLMSIEAEKGDVAVMFTDGLFGLGNSGIEEFVEKIKKNMISKVDIVESLVESFNEVPAYDDKTLSIFEVT